MAKNSIKSIELNKFLMAYRSTPHTTTGASPAKLLLGREIRTKVPCLKRESQINGDVAVKDALLKEKGKIYTDRKRQAADRQIKTGDIVLVKNAKPKNKLSPMFEDALYKVKNKDGNEVTVESEDRVQYRRNSAHVKRYETEECLNPEPVDEEKTSTRENAVSCEQKHEQTLVRPKTVGLQNVLMSIYYTSN